MSTARLAPLLHPRERLALPIMTHHGLDRIGKRVLDCVTDPRVQVNAIVELAGAYPTAAATSVMDLTVEAEAFGARVVFAEHEIPTIAGRLVEDRAQVEALAVPPASAGRLPVYQEAARGAAAAVSDRPVLAGCIGPFSLAARLFGMTEIMTACLLEPDTIALLVRKCTDLLLAHARALKAAGADGLVMAEPAAGLLSADLCDAFSSAYVAEVVAEVQDDGFLFVLHNCGNRGHVTASMVSTGARGLHLGNQADMVEALAAVPPDRVVMGNLDPAGLMRLGTAEGVEAAAGALLAATARHPNFVLSTGCDTPPGVPEENLAALFRALERFNAAHPRASGGSAA
jgi:uroporphyrinogen decarboxylase